MLTLWDLASQPLNFTSRSSQWGDTQSVTEPGARILEVPADWMADRCAYDSNLLNALEKSVQENFTPIQASDELSHLVGSIRAFNEGKRTNLSNEGHVARFLDSRWFPMAEGLLNHFLEKKGLDCQFLFDGANSTEHQRPDIRPRLVYEDGRVVDAGLIELKNEGIVRTYWEDVVDRGKRGVKVNWLGTGTWDEVDKLVVNVATYMAYHQSSWLCWMAVSHLLVFRLVRKPGTSQKPYLVVSDVAQVEDTREPLGNLADTRIGRRWMPAILGCVLASIAGKGDSQFHFHVEDISVVSGSPTLTPLEEEEQISGSSLSSGRSNVSSDGDWTPGASGRTRAAALFVFSSTSGPQGLAAPLVAGLPPRNGSGAQHTLNDSGNKELPFRLWEKGFLMSSLFPKLEIGQKLGEGSTGIVYEGLWDSTKVAVKIADRVDGRKRLERESGWYSWLSQQRTGKVVLPAFLGWYRHSSFDLLIMSHEGDAVVSWDELRPDQRYDLFSMVCELHQAGLRHGDLEPRNVLRSKTGNLCLIDLSEASQHRCNVLRNKVIPLSDERLPPHLCEELQSLCIALGIRKYPKKPYFSGTGNLSGALNDCDFG